jgi:hypothetical protein
VIESAVCCLFSALAGAMLAWPLSARLARRKRSFALFSAACQVLDRHLAAAASSNQTEVPMTKPDCKGSPVDESGTVEKKGSPLDDSSETVPFSHLRGMRPAPKIAEPTSDFPPGPKLSVVNLDDYRGNLKIAIDLVLFLSPAELRNYARNAIGLLAARAQRDDLRSIIQDFLRLARAELADATQDDAETLANLKEWIRQFSDSFDDERRRPDVPAEEPRTKSQDQGGQSEHAELRD